MGKPSVTKLTGLLDKPALLNWANKIGLQGIDIKNYRKQVMNEGTSLHKQIQDYFSSNIPLKDEKDFVNLQKFFEDKKILASEKNIETDWFVGRFDIAFEYDNYSYIADFKLNQKGIYFENKLQLIAYRMGFKVDRIAVIGIPEFNFIPIDIDKYEPYEEILKSLSNIYSFKTQLGE